MSRRGCGPVQLRARHGLHRPERHADRLVLRAEAEWLLEGPPAELASIAAALGNLSDRLSETLLLVNFGNAVGLFGLPYLGQVEVVSSKWDRHHFERMLVELMAAASALPFAGGAASALPYDRSVVAREDVLYHAFVYLRHVLSEHAPAEQRLAPALRTVLREPHRSFERVRHQVSLEAARQIDAAGLLWLARGGGQLVATGSASGPATSLRGHLPLQVDQPGVETTLDTPENQFVKTFLQGALGLVEGMRRAIRAKDGEPSAFTHRLLDDCTAVEQVLVPIVRHPLWDEVGPMVHLPASSTVLQGRRGYREVFSHHARLRLAARVPLAKELVWDLLEAKDIAQLYELWCFFALVQCVERLRGRAAVAGRPQAETMQLTLPWELEVRWDDGTRLLYNPRFSRAQPAPRRSYSVPLRPDVALEVAHGPNAGLHLFDAKFRVEALDAVMPGNEGDDERLEDTVDERRGTFKRGDLYKMHTYRDAIPGTRSVWVLYPGTETRFFAEAGAVVTPTVQPLPKYLNGVGTVALRPSAIHRRELQVVLTQILGVRAPSPSQ